MLSQACGSGKGATINYHQWGSLIGPDSMTPPIGEGADSMIVIVIVDSMTPPLLEGVRILRPHHLSVAPPDDN